MSIAAKNAAASNTMMTAFQIDSKTEAKFFASDSPQVREHEADKTEDSTGENSISSETLSSATLSSAPPAASQPASQTRAVPQPLLMSADGTAVPLSQLQQSDQPADETAEAKQPEPDTVPEKRSKKAGRGTCKAKAPTDTNAQAAAKPAAAKPTAAKRKAAKRKAVESSGDEGDDDLFGSNDEHEDEIEDEIEDDAAEDEQYIVERILAHKGSRFLIKWEGFTEDHNSWEVASNINRELVAAYKSTLPPPRPRPASKPVYPRVTAPATLYVATVKRLDGGNSTQLRKKAEEDANGTGFLVINGEHVNVLSSEGVFSLVKSGRNVGFIKSEYLTAAE